MVVRSILCPVFSFIQSFSSHSVLLTTMPVMLITYSLPWIAGLAIYSVYQLCDPQKAGYIVKMDELVPYFVADKFDYIYGMNGLYLATMFFGGLM